MVTIGATNLPPAMVIYTVSLGSDTEASSREPAGAYNKQGDDVLKVPAFGHLFGLGNAQLSSHEAGCRSRAELWFRADISWRVSWAALVA
jgi:hypothetical protein